MRINVGLAVSTLLLYATLLESQSVILDGPETVIYFPGQEPIELTCNITNGPIALWIVNGTSYSLPDLVQGELENHNASGINIVIKVPVNNTEYICSATTNQKEVESDPAFIFIAGVPNQVPEFTGMADSMTLEGDMLNITLSWGEPFNNFDPIINYTVTCSGDNQCPDDYTTADNTTRIFMVTNLNLTTNYVFTVFATNSLGNGESAEFMTTPLSVPNEATGLSLSCGPSKNEFYNYCDAKWNPVTIGNGPLEQPLKYRVDYNELFEKVASPNTSLVFRAPPVPDGYFVSNVTVSVTAINRFGPGPASQNVSAEIMAPSVIRIIATPNNPDTPSNKYDYTIICTIHPDSTANKCEVTLRNGGFTIKKSSETIDGNATIVIPGLDCQESYAVMAAGLLNGALVGPRTSHETITAGVCFMTINPSTVTDVPTSTMAATPTVVAPSVIRIIATPNNPDTPSNKYDYTFICTIHPDSTANECEVTLRNGGFTIKKSSETIDGNATIVITGLDCQKSYTVMAAGLYNGTLVGPRTSHETITTDVCFMTINPSTVTAAPTSTVAATPTDTLISTMAATPTDAPTSTMAATPTVRAEEGAATGIACSILLIALTTMITMALQC